MRNFFLTLLLLSTNLSLLAQQKEEDARVPLVSKFISLEGYNKWLKEGEYKFGYFPKIIKNKTNITFRLEGYSVGAVTYFPYLEYVCAEAAKNPAAKRELALEMAAWIKTEMVPPSAKDQTYTEIITADLVCTFLFPELNGHFVNGVLAAPLAERVVFAKKIERLCTEMVREK